MNEVTSTKYNELVNRITSGNFDLDDLDALADLDEDIWNEVWSGFGKSFYK